MVIIGLVGMPKSGKGEAVKALIPEGWTPISMSTVLAQMIMQDNPKYQHVKDPRDIPRGILTDEAIHYKESSGNGGIIADECIKIIESWPPDKREKVVIDGIRHPGEINSIKAKFRNSHFLGVIADEDRDEDFEIRWRRHYHDMRQRGVAFEPHQKNPFRQQDLIEWNNPSPWGSQIGACLDMVAAMKTTGQGTIMINEGKDIERWRERVREFSHTLEGAYKHPERKG